MSIFSEWKLNRNLRNEIKKRDERISELEEIISVVTRNSKTEPVNLSLIKEISEKDKEYDLLAKNFDELKLWSDKILELGKQDSSELASIRFRYFKLLKENKIMELNLTGANKGYEFAISLYKKVTEENNNLKKKLEKYERENQFIQKP